MESLTLSGFSTSQVERFVALFPAIRQLNILCVWTPGQIHIDLAALLPALSHLRLLDDLALELGDGGDPSWPTYDYRTLCPDPPPVRTLKLDYPASAPRDLGLVSLFGTTLKALDFSFDVADLENAPLSLPHLTTLSITNTHSGDDGQAEACDLLSSFLSSPIVSLAFHSEDINLYPGEDTLLQLLTDHVPTLRDFTVSGTTGLLHVTEAKRLGEFCAARGIATHRPALHDVHLLSTKPHLTDWVCDGLEEVLEWGKNAVGRARGGQDSAGATRLATAVRALEMERFEWMD